jgi:hypothetical protein
MAPSVKANLLDDGVVDTLGLVGATSGLHIHSLARHIAAEIVAPS